MSDILKWELARPYVILDLANNKKSITSQETFISALNKIKSDLHDHVAIYTDGSKDDRKVGCSVVCMGHTIKLRLPDNSSIFSAETTAIYLALEIIESYDNNKFIIFSDSLSVLQSLTNMNIKNPLIASVLQKHTDIITCNSIVYCWVLSHIGIPGNELADKAAKQALNLNISNSKIPYTDAKYSINKHIRAKWQTSWDNLLANKLKEY